MPDHAPARTTARNTPQPSHPARLSLGDPSPSLSSQNHLRFQLDHALARDAVHTPLDTDLLLRGLSDRNLPVLLLQTNAPDRRTYLRRPDLGRTLHPASIHELTTWTTRNMSSQPEAQGAGAERPAAGTTPTLALILADGLCARALERHALPLLDALLPLITSHLSLVTLVTQARVAIADPIGQLLGTKLTIVLIGERPGLSSPDSLGCYITWDPRPGRTDADRNCISNIHARGLSYPEAATRIAHYLGEAHRLQTTGTTLKDPPTVPTLPL